MTMSMCGDVSLCLCLCVYFIPCNSCVPNASASSFVLHPGIFEIKKYTPSVPEKKGRGGIRKRRGKKEKQKDRRIKLTCETIFNFSKNASILALDR